MRSSVLKSHRTCDEAKEYEFWKGWFDELQKADWFLKIDGNDGNHLDFVKEYRELLNVISLGMLSHLDYTRHCSVKAFHELVRIGGKSFESSEERETYLCSDERRSFSRLMIPRVINALVMDHKDLELMGAAYIMWTGYETDAEPCTWVLAYCVLETLESRGSISIPILIEELSSEDHARARSAVAALKMKYLYLADYFTAVCEAILGGRCKVVQKALDLLEADRSRADTVIPHIRKMIAGNLCPEMALERYFVIERDTMESLKVAIGACRRENTVDRQNILKVIVKFWDSHEFRIASEGKIIDNESASYLADILVEMLKTENSHETTLSLKLIPLLIGTIGNQNVDLSPVISLVVNKLRDGISAQVLAVRALYSINNYCQGVVDYVPLVALIANKSKTPEIINLASDLFSSSANVSHHRTQSIDSYTQSILDNAILHIKQIKMFYLMYRIYYFGADSFSAVVSAIRCNQLLFDSLANEELPVTVQSFRTNLKVAESFFKFALRDDKFTMLMRSNKRGRLPSGDKAVFSDRSQQAWEWSDVYLTGRLQPEWFGFHLNELNLKFND